MDSTFGIAIVGCGTVGNAAASLLIGGTDCFLHNTGTRLTVRALVDVNFDRAKAAGLAEDLFNEDYASVLADPEVHLVVETVGGLTIARTIMEKALKAGKHVVTANKALLAHYGTELFALARKNGVSIGFEASCAGGIPIVRALVDGLSANDNEALYGIVNGTSNFILTEMVENGSPYSKALSMAQAAGLAEADPTLDVNGMDAAHKLTLLASLAFGKRVPLDKIPVEGI
ncbi:MAG: homoserine dehydrogenase, partial [Spirochaetaceae bacterium]|nr:homoserine dehydrogenase [Spirochaetaceae bacterium]